VNCEGIEEMKSYDGAVGNASEANPSLVGYFEISTKLFALSCNSRVPYDAEMHRIPNGKSHVMFVSGLVSGVSTPRTGIRKISFHPPVRFGIRELPALLGIAQSHKGLPFVSLFY
jgi:hypothetical protein